MITKRVLRYYCEHCHKGGQSKSAMTKHETGCTANPNRACGLCRTAGVTQVPMAPLVQKLAEGEISVEDLCSAVNFCPACTLAVVRTVNKDCGHGEESYWFDYRKAHEEWWKEQNARPE